jgi:hypothetical protein
MQSGLLLEHAFKFAKGTLGLTAAKVRTPAQADRWVRLVMAAFAQLLIGRPPAADLRRPWETRPPAGRPLPRAGSAAGLQTSAPAWAPPPMLLNPPGPARDARKAPQAGQRHATQSRTKPAPRTNRTRKAAGQRLKRKLSTTQVTGAGGRAGGPPPGQGRRGTRRWWAAAWPAASSAAAHRRGPLPQHGQPRTRPLAVPADTHPGGRACRANRAVLLAPGMLTHAQATTKIHLVADRRCRPVTDILTPASTPTARSSSRSWIRSASGGAAPGGPAPGRAH